MKISKNGKNYLVLRFLVVYGILMGLFIFLIGYQPVKDVLDINGYFTALLIKMTVIFLKLFGFNPVVEGSIITINNFSMNVLFGCNGLEAFLIYTVGIISFPAKISHKIWGIVGGFFVLQILNVLRITALGFSGIYFKDYFDFIHIYLAQSIMIVFSVIMFIVWINYASKK